MPAARYVPSGRERQEFRSHHIAGGDISHLLKANISRGAAVYRVCASKHIAVEPPFGGSTNPRLAKKRIQINRAALQEGARFSFIKVFGGVGAFFKKTPRYHSQYATAQRTISLAGLPQQRQTFPSASPL
jgi:hypothetical protein